MMGRPNSRHRLRGDGGAERGRRGRGGRQRRRAWTVRLLVHRQTHVPSYLPLRFAPPEVAAAKILQIGGMDRPVMALPVRASPRFHEAVVQRQIVPDRVPPPWATGTKVRIMLQYVLINVGQDKLLLGGREYSHRDQTDVTVLRFRLLGDSLMVRVEQRHGQGQPARVSGRGRRRRVQGQGGREPRSHSQVSGGGGGRVADTWVLGVQLLGEPQSLGHRVMVQLKPVVLEAGQETGHWVAKTDGQRFLGRWRAFVATHD